MTEIIDLEDFISQIEEKIVTQNLTIKKACEELGITESIFYHQIKKLDEKKFAQLFARAREVRGLSILDDCLEAFERMKNAEDGKAQWKEKNIIDQGMRLAAMYNKNLSERPLVQNNTQNNFYSQDDFVLKKLETINEN